MNASRQGSPRILITGFGPFPGVDVNMSAELAKAAQRMTAAHSPDASIIAETLPTEWVRGLARIDELWALHQPSAALHLGVSANATGFVIERAAYNACSPNPDACGQLPG
ncbi:MAG: pyroglutamyl-peptidase I, partial [Hyphomicrobiaceae bacterium]